MASSQHAAGWSTKQLVDCTSDGNISYGIVQPGRHVEDGIPILRVNNFRGGVLDGADALRVSASVEKDYQRTRLKGGELLLTLVGSVGQTAIVSADYAGWNVARAIAVIRPSKDITAKWLAICLQSAEVRHFLDGRANTTVQKTLNLGDVKQVPIPIPPEETRLRIESMITSLDDKIDINRRINQTLEAMAQAIFKSWFVDFDPVKAKIVAKAEGRDPLRAAMTAISGKPGAELDTLPPDQFAPLAATAALFPNEMESSGLGEIPRGWEIVTVGQVADVIKGKSYSSKDLVDNTQTALVTLKSFERGGGFRMDGFKPYVGVFKSAQVVEPGELIVAYTDVTQAAELIGRPAIVVGVDKYQTLVASLDVGIVRPHLNQVSRQFLFGLFSTDTFQAHTFAHTSGTTVLHLAKDGVPSFRFAKPPSDLINNFSNYADPVVAMKQSALDQIAALTELRDALLPKLLSGELQVQYTEAEVVA